LQETDLCSSSVRPGLWWERKQCWKSGSQTWLCDYVCDVACHHRCKCNESLIWGEDTSSAVSQKVLSAMCTTIFAFIFF